MKSPLRQRRVRSLKAKAAVMDSPADFDDYGPEPNMKLSHAFMVVLALHVIAVGGLFAFNKVKAGHSKASEKVRSELATAQEAAASEEVKPASALHELEKVASKIVEPQQTAAVAPKTQAVATSLPAKINSPDLHAAKTMTVPSSAPALAAPVITATATTTASTVETAVVTAPQPAIPEAAAATEYTIVKGDNPYKIAKRFHVSYDSLIKLNKITDPRKIQIGQKLKIPAAAPHKAAQHG